MGSMQVVGANVVSAETRAVIIRADGSTEDLGVIAYYHKNPLKRLAYKLRERFNRG